MQTLPCLTCLAALASLLVSGCANTPVPAGTLPGEPVVQRRVAEDDQVRITELRVRGQTQRIHVDPKGGGVPGYEVNPPAPGSDPSKARDGAGQRVWPVLSF